MKSQDHRQIWWFFALESFKGTFQEHDEAISNFQTNILRTSSAFHSQKSVFLRRLLMLHIRRTWEGKKGKKSRTTDIFLSFEGCFTKMPGDRWCFTWWIWKLSSTRNPQKSLCLWKVACKLALADPKQPVVWAPFTGIWSLPPSPKATFFGSVFFNVLRS